MQRPVSIVDIARESGVSIATVSRVLNGSAPVSEKTREKVNRVIRKYRYTPSSISRNLSAGRNKTIGILMPDISNPYFSSMFSEFELAAHEAGYTVLLCNSSFRAARIPEAGPQEQDYFRMLLSRQVDGVLVVGGQADVGDIAGDYRAALRELAETVPVVVLGNPIEGVNCQFIQRERGQGVFSAVNYLATLGHRRIAFLGGEDGVDITQARLEAYQLALDALHLERDAALIRLSDYYAPEGYSAAKALLESKTSYTAVLAMNDNVALGAYRAFADAALSVPEDVSVISCDQFYWADYMTPRLTSIDQHNELFGRFIINTLLGAMQGLKDPVLLNHKPELVIRESCAAPRAVGKE